MQRRKKKKFGIGKIKLYSLLVILVFIGLYYAGIINFPLTTIVRETIRLFMF